jgi:cyclophilin family peptidyl-prolyl cis-trans isomerase
MRPFVAPALVALFLAAGCSDDSTGIPPSITPDADIPPAETFSVEFKTTAGDLIVDVTRAWSPLGADRFRELVEVGFYDDCRVFRVLPGFIAQFGMNGDPDVQRMWSNETFDDDPVLESNLRATMSFASAGPNTRTTQLFINYGDNSRLDDMGFSPFGVVRSGMDSADAFNADYGETPEQVEISGGGNEYLDTFFPNLDTITTARVLP